MSRKKASFAQLIDYMNKELSSPHTIGHNLYMGERTTSQDIIQEFEQNAEYLPKRKNGNYLYHEVISFEKNEISQDKMDEIIIELAELYLSERAPQQLAYAVIHRDTEKPHIHFCISANELGSDKRKRLTKKKFADLQKNLERYALEKFPELESKLVYTKQRNSEKARTTSREQELKKRTGKISQKDLLKNTLHGLFELSNSKKELDQHLEKAGYAIYTRGKNAGIEKTDSGKKHRFTTLGVMEHYLSALERFDSLEKGKRQQAQNKEQELKQKAEQEQQQREQQQAAEELHRQQEVQKQAELQAEAQRQAELKAQRVQEEARRQAEQQKRSEILEQQQREEYEAEKAAEEKRREAFLSRQKRKPEEQERQKQKPAKTQRRQRTEQVRRDEEKARPARKPEAKKPVEQGRKKANVTPTAKQKEGEKTTVLNKKRSPEVFEKSRGKIKKATSPHERDFLASEENEKTISGISNNKEQDKIRDRLSELDSITNDKSKDRNRER